MMISIISRGQETPSETIKSMPRKMWKSQWSLRLKCRETRRSLKRLTWSWRDWLRMTMMRRTMMQMVKRNHRSLSVHHSHYYSLRRPVLWKMLSSRVRKTWLMIMKSAIFMKSLATKIVLTMSKLKVPCNWLSRRIKRTKFLIQAHQLKMKNCSERSVSSKRKRRSSSMLRWLKRWSDKNSHLTSVRHRTALNLSQSLPPITISHLLNSSVWVLMPYKNRKSSLSSRNRDSKASKHHLTKMNQSMTPNWTFLTWSKKNPRRLRILSRSKLNLKVRFSHKVSKNSHPKSSSRALVRKARSSHLSPARVV